MSRRKSENRSPSGLLPASLQTQIKTDNFHSFYEVESKELGRGKFAVVRKCIAKATGQEYAAKFLKKRRRGQDCKAEILHEIAILELTKPSPRVVNLHEAYETTNEIILVLEYAAGGEIFNLCLPDLEEAIDETDIIRLIRQILEGVYHLHQNNIVHLDLKPQNILLSGICPLGDIKIVDFGMSRKIGNCSELREIVGTPEYQAPEVLNYDPITTATDIWSVGIISYMLLTHESPFVGADKQETYLNISQVNVDYSEETFASISSLARDFIQKLLVKNPEERPTAEACLSHSWLQQESLLLYIPEESPSSSATHDHMNKCTEERNNNRPMCNGMCSEREDKENIPEDGSMVSKRFRFDDSLQYPQEFTTDFVC
ncbi:serine/threonine-protein kinase 17B [Hemicordylus capensis]|uniref:serine/threonine-protein kinase 17B n=1 Tax=Hemicordylus capensis TaxID=884348 RepID=UPI002304BC8B|nr:serine/threonine-protein kinase 17B [Hemicordylus capensis]XP_053140451.1 serine/threonine-protein kinase 17B [Hemicordylus capensis]